VTVTATPVATPTSAPTELPAATATPTPLPTIAWTTLAYKAGGSSAAISGTLAGGGNAITLSAVSGKFESTKEANYFAYTTVSGDFTLIARVSSISQEMKVSTSYQYRAGLQLCDGCTSEAITPAPAYAQSSLGVYAAATMYPVYAHRLSAGASYAKNAFATKEIVTAGSSLYLKLVRAGSTYQAFYSTDGGVSWVAQGASSTAEFTSLPSALQVGFFAAPGLAKDTSITFDNISIKCGTSETDTSCWSGAASGKKR
jgi:hypothetical protein